MLKNARVGLATASLAALLAAGMIALSPAHPAHAEATNAQEDATRLDALRVETKRLIDAGKPSEAEAPARQAIALAERVFGKDNPQTAATVNDLAVVLVGLGRLDEAASMLRRTLAIREQSLPENHPDIAVTLNNLAEVLRQLNRLDEAEPLFRRALAIFERSLPENHPDLAVPLESLAVALSDLNRLDEAEQLSRRALAIQERSLPASHLNIAISLNNLATVLTRLGRLDEAEQLTRRALAIREQSLPASDPLTAASLNNLADILSRLGRLNEAEQFYRRALAIYEQSLPENHPDIAMSLNNLATLFLSQNRLVEAERVLRRALAIREQARHRNLPGIATTLNNLGQALKGLARRDEAVEVHRRALAMREQSLPANHPDIGQSLDNLAATLADLDRLDEAVEFHRRALAIYEQSLPQNHPQTAGVLNNLGAALVKLRRLDEAEAVLRRALAIQRQSLPENHTDIAMSLENLGVALASRGRHYEEALALMSESTRMRVAPENRRTASHHPWRLIAFNRVLTASLLAQRDGDAAAETLTQARHDGFVELQWAGSAGAGGAIAAAMARARADPEVALLARERDRLLGEIKGLDDGYVAISSNAAVDRDARSRELARLRADAEQARQRLAGIDADIARRFPGYAELSEGLPLAWEDLLPLLRPDEVLVSITPYGQIGLLYAYSREGEFIAGLPDAGETAALAARLRCSAAGSLDPACPGGLPAQAAADDVSARGAVALGQGTPGDFDLALAHDLYERLFPVETRELMRGKKMIIVPAPELMGLPWHLLLTQAPPAGWNAAGADRAADYRKASWLFQSHPSITVLPTVAALRALRGTQPQRKAADRALLGVGDPVIGRNKAERDAPPLDCGLAATALLAAADAALPRSPAAGPWALFSEVRDADGFSLADPWQVRSQPRLPDTRCELAAVAASLGGQRSDLLFGADATETAIRALDENGELSRYRILHFATHGLLGGQLGLGEPGLVLTPPKQATARDDGILTASEIATLTLAADWVVLSACNTAAGSTVDAEAFSGLARSFFYAGARSLLVSAWPVYSSAAVSLTTSAFAAMNQNPEIGRAEALTIAMRNTLAAADSQFTAHPSYWAPFTLVGEGSR